MSLLPEKHIAIGTSLPTYIDVITGPSKTADIEKKIVHGMYGPSEVHLILLDNGRSNAMKHFKELFHCIGCGACLTVCPISVHLGSTFGREGYLGGRGVIFSAVNIIEIAIKNGLFLCTFCSACEKICPCEIPIPEYIHKLRIDAIKKGLGFEIHKKIANSIMKYGNPYLGFRCYVLGVRERRDLSTMQYLIPNTYIALIAIKDIDPASKGDTTHIIAIFFTAELFRVAFIPYSAHPIPIIAAVTISPSEIGIPKIEAI